MTFQSARKDIAAMVHGLRKAGTGHEPSGRSESGSCLDICIPVRLAVARIFVSPRPSAARRTSPHDNASELARDVSMRMQIRARCRGTVVTSVHSWCMKRGDVICPQCNAGFRRIELASRSGKAGEFRCPLCDQVLEVFDGSTEIAYRITVAPEKLFE
jgi:uncharacterized Zn-finger protein